MTAGTKLYFLSIYHATPSVPLSEQSLESITHRGSISCLETQHLDKEPLILRDGLHMPDGIALSKRRGLMFWTQMGTPGKNDGSIYCADLEGKDPRSLLPQGTVNTPKQIVLDDEDGQLYFCDREGMRIHRCKTDGSEHEILLQTGDWENEQHMQDQSRWCVGIAVSKELGRMYWTQKGAPKSKKGRIFSANLEIPAGETASTRSDVEIVAENLPEPIDLEIDESSEVLYWTDRGEFPFGNTLNRKHLVAATPQEEKVLGREILAEGFGEAIGLALDEKDGGVWVADLCGRIWRCDAHRPVPKKKIFESETSVFTGLALL